MHRERWPRRLPPCATSRGCSRAGRASSARPSRSRRTDAGRPTPARRSRRCELRLRRKSSPHARARSYAATKTGAPHPGRPERSRAALQVMRSRDVARGKVLCLDQQPLARRTHGSPRAAPVASAPPTARRRRAGAQTGRAAATRFGRGRRNRGAREPVHVLRLDLGTLARRSRTAAVDGRCGARMHETYGRRTGTSLGRISPTAADGRASKYRLQTGPRRPSMIVELQPSAPLLGHSSVLLLRAPWGERAKNGEKYSRRCCGVAGGPRHGSFIVRDRPSTHQLVEAGRDDALPTLGVVDDDEFTHALAARAAARRSRRRSRPG